MDIIHMLVEILVVTKGMFPKPPLPNACLFSRWVRLSLSLCINPKMGSMPVCIRSLTG